MLRLSIILLSLFFISTWENLSMAAETLKKISILKTNNSPDFLLIGRWIAEPSDIAYLTKLKTYVGKKGFNPEEKSELDFVLSALAWVSAQWVHDGMNQPPKTFRALDILHSVHKKGIRYRCVEYGQVLAEVLQSYGFVTRTVALRTNDVAYGGFGQGHVAMEVWINDLNKWIFLDPQFGAYLTAVDGSNPLNFYEAFLEKKSGRWEKLKAHFTPNSTNPSMPKDPKEAEKGYKEFLKNYMGHMAVSSHKSKEKVSLMMESEEMPLTFQGSESSNAIFTKHYEIIYPEMNRVAILLNYKEQGLNFQKTMERLNIKTEEDYLKNMPAFAAKPNFIVSLTTSSKVKNVKFEYRLSRNSSWSKMMGESFSWDATKPLNYLEARMVNRLGRRGPSTFIELKYE